jgi:uncharacterized RDD family membrane protein YckC
MSNIAQPAANTSAAASEMKVATTGQRLMTFILDMLFYYIAGFVVLAILDRFLPGERLASRQDYVFGVVLFILYYTLQEAFWGRTLGKVIAGTKVVKEDGSRISFVQALVRTLFRFIFIEFISFFGGHGRPVGWHDRIARTKVVVASNQ